MHTHCYSRTYTKAEAIFAQSCPHNHPPAAHICHVVVNENWAGMFSQSFLFGGGNLIWTSTRYFQVLFRLEAGFWCLSVVL